MMNHMYEDAALHVADAIMSIKKMRSILGSTIPGQRIPENEYYWYMNESQPALAALNAVANNLRGAILKNTEDKEIEEHAYDR